MAVPGTIQALIAAFAFGILFNAASSALILYVKSHGSAIYRDGLRLALILFLISSSSWALVEFLSTLVDPAATSTCQVAVIFSSLFDQFGRVFIEQYLAWVVRKESEKTTLSLLPQILVLGRLAVGIAFVSVTRVGFHPTCAPVTSVQAVAYTAIALDGVILGLLALNTFTENKKKSAQATSLGKASVRLVVAGLAVWIGTSVTLQLGIESLDLFYKTILPGLGLIVLVVLVTVLFQGLVEPLSLPRRPDSPVSRGLDGSRDLSSSDSVGYPPTRYEDLKLMETVSVSAIRRENSKGVRRNENGTFPAISRPMTADSDANGSVTQGQLFPSVEATGETMAVPPVPALPRDVNARVERSKAVAKAKGKSGKIVISNPILIVDESAANPLQKIPTIGLAEAAEIERLRREKLARRVSGLVASRPAPKPPSPPKAFDAPILRKEVPDALERSNSAKTNETSGGLSVEGNASSTGSQLSPGSEAIRRRSPRQLEPTATTTPFKVIRPGDPIRIPIPQPPQPAQEEPVVKPEPTKTPLQRRPTIGLPSNPRARAMNALNEESQHHGQQTVMFVNNIVYDDPNTINDIVQGAKLPPPNPRSSVVNRPRPIPRKDEKDRQVFPSEISEGYGHRRSKSGSSLLSRKSFLYSAAGSPDGLPSLPPLPKLTEVATKALPNDTRDVTEDKKMNLPIAAPTTAPLDKRFSQHQHPSVALASGNMPEPPIFVKEPYEPLPDGGERASISSKRTTVRTLSVLGIIGDQQYLQRGTETEIAKQVHDADKLGSDWLPGIGAGNGDRVASEDIKRRSSQVLPLSRQQSTLTDWSGIRTPDEDVAVNWASIHSPIAPVSRQNARSTYIGKEPESTSAPGDASILIPIALDTREVENQLDVEEDDISAVERPTSPQVAPPQFHHRVGDSCPTFSTRSGETRTRKMPPPTPLLLNERNTKRVVVVQTAEPSPVESPEVAYQAIQAQLKRFDEPDRAQVDSSDKRLALLDNLELEMGQLESKWQAKQLDRDSMSTLRTSPNLDSRPVSTAAPYSGFSSQRSSVASMLAERRALRRSRLQSGIEEGLSSQSSSRYSSQSSANTQASLWQSRLAQAQMEYMEQAPELLMRRNNLNFLSVSKAGLGSPSPPETDESDDETQENVGSFSPVGAISQKPVKQLWTHPKPVEQPPFSWLWNVQVPQVVQRERMCHLPGLSVRPATRRLRDALHIESSRLWQPSSKSISTRRSGGLWEKEPQRRESLRASRPLTMRPPRRSKRMTALPDIIENPEPLPNNRGTLGIFQFPWGEKSEHPTVQYRPSMVYVAMPGTMTSGRSFMPPLPQLGTTETSEYSSSFFDEYDEEEGDNFSDFMGSDPEDDDFDETTLWEIASLLNTNQIPSRDSLLPPSPESTSPMDASVLADYVGDMPADEKHIRQEPQEIRRQWEHVLAHKDAEITEVCKQFLLWTPPNQDQPRSLGLPQKSQIWRPYNTEPVAKPRTRSTLAKDLESLHSRSLWRVSAPTIETPGQLLWTAPKRMVESIMPPVVPVETRSLWNPSAPIASPRTSGLFTTRVPRANYRTTMKDPITITTSAHTCRYGETKLPCLTSSSLWNPRAVDLASIDGLWSSRKEGSVETRPVANIRTVGLWTEPVRLPEIQSSALFDPTIKRADFRRTPNIPAALNVTLPALASTALWARQPVSRDLSRRQEKCLWRQRDSLALPVPTLFQVDPARKSYRTTAAEPAALVMTRRRRTLDHPVEHLQSIRLWQSGQTARPELNWILLSRKPSPTPSVSGVESSSSSSASGDDATPTALPVPMLFQVDPARKVYRTTSAEPAAKSMTRRQRSLKDPLKQLQSARLWQTGQTNTPELNWISVSSKLSPRPAAPIVASSSLSSPPEDNAMPVAHRAPMLFQVDPTRKTYRTTSAEPAAKRLTRRPRTLKDEVEQLQSSRLWQTGQTTRLELNWILMATQRPSSPSSSVITSNSSMSSPTTSATTSETVAPINKAPAPKSTGIFGGWFSKKSKKDKKLSPVKTEQTKPKPTVATEAAPELPDDFIVRDLDASPRVKPLHTSLRHQYRSNFAYNGNWDHALAEAIAASYPGTMLAARALYPQDWDLQMEDAIAASHIAPTLVRQKSTPRDWAAALHEAVLRSYPELRYSRGQSLPSQWKAALEEVVDEDESVSFDVSVRHPVFFGSLQSSAETVHPALTGYRAVVSQSTKQDASLTASTSLWTASSNATVPHARGLWISKTEGSENFAMESIDKPTHPTRSHRRMGGREAPEVQLVPVKGNLWKRDSGGNKNLRHASQREKNWMQDSMNSRFSRVQLRY